MKSNQIPMFATANDTDQWAVAVDGFYELFQSEEEARAVYKSLGASPGENGLDDTPFGSAQILHPRWRVTSKLSLLSDYEPENLRAYIAAAHKHYGKI